VLTRRASAALALGVIMVLATLNYSRYMTATQAKERKKFEEEMEEMELHNGHPAQRSSAHHHNSAHHNSTEHRNGGGKHVPSGEALLASEGVSLN
jgi:hypothetical protein